MPLCRVELVQEFARLRPGGIVEFPGGEVTLALDELCTLARACSDAGLGASSVTSGSRGGARAGVSVGSPGW